MISNDTLRRSTERTTLLPAAFAVSFNSGLKSIDRPFHPRLPAAPQRLIEADDRLQPRELRLHQGGKKEVFRSSRDKGHAAEVEAFLAACRSGEQPWPFEDMVAVTEATFDIRDALQGREPDR